MIDLTPLDVRNKRGDFKKIMRGYDPHEVDVFLEITAERLEVLVREALHLRERTQSLEDQVSQQADRERAVQDALVSAQGLRADIEAQSQRESEQMIREAQSEAKQLLANAEAEVRRILIEADDEVRSRVRGIERRVDQASSALEDLERSRVRFLKEFGSLLDREREVVRVEMDRTPFDERAIDMDLGGRTGVGPGASGLGSRTTDGVEGDHDDPLGAPSASSDPAGHHETSTLVDAAEEEVLDAADVVDHEGATPTSREAEINDEPEVEVETDSGPESATDQLPAAEAVSDDVADAEFEARVESATDLEPESRTESPGSNAEPDTGESFGSTDAPGSDAAPVADGTPGTDAAPAKGEVAPTLDELKAEMEATLGLGVTSVPVSEDQPPLRAEGAGAMPPPLPEARAEGQSAADRYVPSESELIIEAADEPMAEAAHAEYLEVGPVDPSPETWSEPVSTLELAPDLPAHDEIPEAEATPMAGAPIDINSLSPEPASPAPEGGLAALDTRGSRGAGPFEGVPDLETVLAEAGIEEVVPPPLDEPTSRSIGGERDNLILFEPEDHERRG